MNQIKTKPKFRYIINRIKTKCSICFNKIKRSKLSSLFKAKLYVRHNVNISFIKIVSKNGLNIIHHVPYAEHSFNDSLN